MSMAESHSPKTLNERQISIDPISLKDSSRREPSFNLMLPPLAVTYNSLPNSACSSPRFSFSLLKKKVKHESHASPRQIDRLTSRHSAVHNVHDQDHEVTLRRTKSCAEVRPSVDDFDFVFAKPNASIENNAKVHENCKIEEEFKCSALCIYLPGFGKGKVVKSKKEIQEVDVGGVISRTVSLEKFECGSWASSAITNDYEGDGGYFDLPLELIQNSGNDTNSPVSAAFIFDKDRKGALKNGSRRVQGRKSTELDRHVRFSTSSPSSNCITPRLRKARDDFNAFLEAQAA